MLRPEDLLKLQYVRDGRLDPDGRRVAYTVSRTDDAERFEVWIGDLDTGTRERLPFAGDASMARWSPDGSRLAFIGDDRVCVADAASLAITPLCTPDGWAPQGAPSWSPDGRRLAVSLHRQRPAGAARRVVQETYRADAIGFHDIHEQTIWILGLDEVAPWRLTSGASLCFSPAWSPCGARVLFFSSQAPAPFSSYSPTLMTAEVEGGGTTTVLDGNWYVTAAQWLPGGDRIAVAAARDSTLTIPAIDLWVVSQDGDEASLRTANVVGNVGCRATHDMPAWDLTNGNVFTVLDDATALASIHRGGSVEIWRVGLAGEPRAERVVGGDRTCIVLDARTSTSRLLFARTDLLSPAELSLANLDGTAERPLTDLNGAVLAQWPDLRVEHISFESAGGLAIETWFLARRDLALPAPTVLFIHGGPFSATGHAFRYDFHLLAAHGFGVLFANFRGSAGYGEDFVRAIMGDWCGKGYPDHIGATEAAVGRGLADPERLGVWGPSYGGSATCWIVGHTDRFKAAIAEAAGVNLATRYYISDIPDVFRRDLGGTPHELPEAYRERSPITYAHRCTTPTLLLHGEDDLRCPISEAEQFFRALQDVGCTTELFRIRNCSHLGDSIGPLSARVAQNEALLDWFRRFL